MKKFFNIFMVVATIATTFVSCSKELENNETPTPSGKMKTVTVKTNIATKTTLDSNHENLLWSAGDVIKIFNNADTTSVRAPYVAGGDLVIEVPETTTEIYAHYPYYRGNNTGPKSVSVYIGNTQTQKNPGELNGYNYPMVAKGTVSADNKALISLYPVASALALNIYHTGLDGEEKIKSVTVTPTANTQFIGSQVTDLTGDNITFTTAASSDPITVTLTNSLTLTNSAPDDKQTFNGQIYVCLAKQSYKSVKFEIATTKGTYTITSSATVPFDCENNDFVPVNINLNKATFVENDPPVDPTSFTWGLVKDALTVGDKVVIAAAGSNVAMSTEQKANNRGQIDITKSGSSLTAVTDVQVFEVVAGSKSNTVALKCLNGSEIGKYIAAASNSSNNMHSNSDIDDNASWSITIDGTTGVAGVTAQGTYTRNVLKYNSGNNLFSCYASTNTMADVVFYRSSLPSANLSFPQESYTVNLGEVFTAPTLTNPYNVSVTYTTSNSDIAAVNASTGAVTIGSTAGKATITATFTGNSTYSFTEASYEINVIDPNVERWVKTAIGSVSSSDVFVIVGGGYAVTNDKGTSEAPAAVSVTITNDALSDIPAANLQWTISGNATDGYVFYPNGDSTVWLYCTNTNNGVRVGTNNNSSFTIDKNGYLIHKATNRYLSLYSDSQWRCYSNTDNNPKAMEFYVKKGGSSTPAKTLSSITVTPPTKTTYTVGDSFDATGMVVTATYSDASTADVTSSATTDFATQVASAGNKTVTVSYTEGGITKTDSFDITVEAATVSSSVTFDFTSISETVTGGWNGDHTVTPITINASNANTNKAGQVRFQVDGTVTFTGATITRIEINNLSNYAGSFTADSGNYSVSGSTGIWTGSATSVVLTLGGNSGTRTTSIVVYYE